MVMPPPLTTSYVNVIAQSVNTTAHSVSTASVSVFMCKGSWVGGDSHDGSRSDRHFLARRRNCRAVAVAETVLAGSPGARRQVTRGAAREVTDELVEFLGIARVEIVHGDRGHRLGAAALEEGALLDGSAISAP